MKNLELMILKSKKNFISRMNMVLLKSSQQKSEDGKAKDFYLSSGTIEAYIIFKITID